MPKVKLKKLRNTKVLAIIISTWIILCLSFLMALSLKELNYLAYVSSEFKNFFGREFTKNEEMAISLSTHITFNNIQDQSQVSPSGKLLYQENSTNPEVEKLLAGIRVIESNVAASDLKNKYIMSPLLGVLYFFNPQHYNLRNSSYITLVKNNALFNTKGQSLGFYTRLFGWVAEKRLGSVTGIYRDRLTGELEDTMISPFYNIKNGQLVGAVYTDITFSLNKAFATPLIGDKQWLSLYLHSIESNSGYCIIGDCGAGTIKTVMHTSETYTITGGLDIMSMMLNNYFFVIFALSTFVIAVVIFLLHKRQIGGHYDKICTDPLTKLYNRNILNHVNANDYRAIIMYDCNKFKKINDDYGHQIGDFAIKHISSCIMRNIRQDDIAVRYGGDEFIVLLKNEYDKATSVAERISQDIEKNPLVIDAEILHLSVSYGVAPVIGELSSAINVADKKMFYHKNAR